MFIDQEWKKQSKEIPDAVIDEDHPPIYKNPYFIFGAVFFLSLALLLVIILSYIYKPSISIYTPPADSHKTTGPDVSTSSLSGLPVDPLEGGNGSTTLYDFSDLKAENLRFGQYYKPFDREYEIKIKSYTFPINVKAEVVNYYDLSRKIDLTPAIDMLNNNGFAILENQLGSAGSDFFSMQRELQRLDTPLLISTDMVWYYHQNSLKEVFKEIEKNVFFEYVWDTYKQLYDISLARYRKRLSEIGQINDTVLEAERLQTAYLATTLALLKPRNDQIITDKNLVNDNKFSPLDVDYYFFDMPPDIARDVEKELRNVFAHQGEQVSPVMLYRINYKDFVVPEQYKAVAKLNNYFLATQWTKVSFPLHYRQSGCPDCALDYDDWLINFVAAAFLSKDMSDNQELKNKWAVIYKFIAFFEGLRSELTYLHYHNFLAGKFGADYELEKIFTGENLDNREFMDALIAGIAANRFLPIEGGLDRDSAANRKAVGMRLLQTQYWPDDYIFDELSGPDLVAEADKGDSRRITFCRGKESNQAGYRCLGFGADILSILGYQPENNPYFLLNTEYDRYQEKIAGIRGQLGQFDASNWNSNIYWMNYDLAESLTGFSDKYHAALSLSSRWREKNQNLVLGSWVSLNLPGEKFVNYEAEQSAGLGQFFDCNNLNYIEPNLDFYNDLLARGNMLYDVVNILPVGKKTNAAAIAIKEINTRIKNIIEISKKELSQGSLNENDCQFITDFSTSLKAEQYGERGFTYGNEGRTVRESISGVDLLVLLYMRGDEKVAAVGPIFNYEEK